jgi:TonB family protein
VAGHSGVVNPVALYKPDPDYSDDARKAKLQGTVVLEVVVDRDGRTQIRKVLQSLGLGLDEQAIKAVSLWRFKAGTKDGKLVPVLVQVLVSFRLL